MSTPPRGAKHRTSLMYRSGSSYVGPDQGYCTQFQLTQYTIDTKNRGTSGQSAQRIRRAVSRSDAQGEGEVSNYLGTALTPLTNSLLP